MKAEDRYDKLRLENQICFPLYVCSREIVRKYKPFLDKINLTYTQYITMMVMWERKEMNVKTLGEFLYLDSGTLTPVLKKLEGKGYLTRNRARKDERNLLVSVTEKGEALREQAVEIPQKMEACIQLEKGDTQLLYEILHKMMERQR